MTRTIAIGGLLLAGFFVGTEGIGLPAAHAGGPGDDRSQTNGDLNCDSSVDIGDVVYMLDWLFRGGQAPCPAADSGDDAVLIAELQEQVSERDAEILRLEAELQGERDALAVAEAALVATQGSLLVAETSLSSCTIDLATCTVDLDATEQDLEATRTTLAEVALARDVCQAELAKEEPQLAECVGTLTVTQTALNRCEENVQQAEEELVVAAAALTAAAAELIVVEADLLDAEAAQTAAEEELTVALERIIELEGGLDRSGCTDPVARNYDPCASVDDGSCVFGAAPEIPDGFTFVRRSVQGYDEYSHDQTGIVFVLLPGGEFQMGSSEDEPNSQANERPVHTVALSPFLLAKYEVTQEQYAQVLDGHPSLSAYPSVHSGDQLPVERVSWADAMSTDGFLARTGLELPTEAQWEYACRAGTSTAFYFGDDCNGGDCEPCDLADDFMWWCGNLGLTTHPVGTMPANPFGLYDMHANVYEWCQDVFVDGFYGTPEAVALDPVADADNVRRISRGGSWHSYTRKCRSAFRFVNSTRYRSVYVGIRPAVPMR